MTQVMLKKKNHRPGAGSCPPAKAAPHIREPTTSTIGPTLHDAEHTQIQTTHQCFAAARRTDAVPRRLPGSPLSNHEMGTRRVFSNRYSRHSNTTTLAGKGYQASVVIFLCGLGSVVPRVVPWLLSDHPRSIGEDSPAVAQKAKRFHRSRLLPLYSFLTTVVLN